MMNEIWKTIPNFEDYEASNMGRIRSKPRDTRNQYKEGVIKTPRNGIYLTVILYKNGIRFQKTVHRLVAETFFGVNNELVVNHINENKHDNRLSNLEFVTLKENCNHGTAIERSSKNRMKKVKCSNGKIYNSLKECARDLGLQKSKISNVCHGKRKTTGGLKFEYI